MKLMFFKVFLKVAHWLAPHQRAAKNSLGRYFEEEKREKEWERCQARQKEMDACIRPRTEFHYQYEEDEQ